MTLPTTTHARLRRGSTPRSAPALAVAACVACACAASASAGSPDPWLAAQTTRILNECKLTAHDGTVLYTPDGVGAYGAQWTRDFAYALENAPSAFNDSQASALAAAVNYTFAGQRADGCMPDRVQADGLAVYSPGGTSNPFADHAIDNMPFAGKLLAAYMDRYASVPGRSEAAARLFCALEPQVRHALDFPAKSQYGLLWNDIAAPNCTYGFTDTVAKQGQLLFSSLLYYDASLRMAKWAASSGCGNVTQYRAEAALIKTSLTVPSTSMFNASIGWFLACDQGANALPDVWGSALAVQLGVATPQQSAAVVGNLVAQAGSLFQRGQLRHLPVPLVWGKCFGGCPRPGTYQNGAFWATPLSWVTAALRQNGHADLAQSIVNDTLASYHATDAVGGIIEAINADIGYTGARDYVDSATNVLAATAA